MPDDDKRGKQANNRDNRDSVTSFANGGAREKGGELKIKGQADAGKKKSKWEEEREQSLPDQGELERRESELKERALRNKVVRTRKGSTNVAAGN